MQGGVVWYLGSGIYELWVVFLNVDGIEIGIDIWVVGVKVGWVSGIDLDLQIYLVEVWLCIFNDIQLLIDSVVLIQLDGLLGGVYIELQLGGVLDLLQVGDEIEDVQGVVSLIFLMMKFVDL